jgi:hypothetical protein
VYMLIYAERRFRAAYCPSYITYTSVSEPFRDTYRRNKFLHNPGLRSKSVLCGLRRSINNINTDVYYLKPFAHIPHATTSILKLPFHLLPVLPEVPEVKVKRIWVTGGIAPTLS